MSKSVTAAALVVGTMALLFALVSLIWMISSHVEKDNSREELLGKLQKLEKEHISRLKKLEDENDLHNDEKEENNLLLEAVTEKLVREYERPSLCSLIPNPGPCRSHVYRWYFLPKVSCQL